MRVTATETNNRFGSLCAQAQREPVFVDKAGLLDTVILCADQYQALKAGQDTAKRAARESAFEGEFGACTSHGRIPMVRFASLAVAQLE